MFTTSSNPDEEAPTSARAGEEVLVSEQAAAFLVRQRAADIVEIIEILPDQQTKDDGQS
jgi:hypothetical protein